MRYNIAICDDSSADREYVSTMVWRWSMQTRTTVKITEYTSAENFLFRSADGEHTDILLLDIEMGTMDGVTLAKKLRWDNETMQIVFITGYSDYIAEGYEVSALQSHEARKGGQAVLCPEPGHGEAGQERKILQFQLSGETVRVPIYQIRYADVSGNYVTVHAASEVTLKMTLGDLEKKLDDRFHRAGRSAIVNLGCISRNSEDGAFTTENLLPQQ